MSPEGEELHAEDNLYFHNTQMQSIHEETLAEESHAQAIQRSISRLSSFKHEDTDSESPIPVQKVIRQIKKTNTNTNTTKTKKRKLKVSKPRKNMSLSESVRQMYGSRKNGEQQGSIDGFLMSRFGDVDGCNESDRSSKLISQGEWESLSKFHEESNEKDKLLRKKIQRYYSEPQEELGEGCGMLSQASADPETKMTKEELESLYDLDSSTVFNQTTISAIGDMLEPTQVSEPCVVILSQTKVQSEALTQEDGADASVQEIKSSVPTQELFSTPEFVPAPLEQPVNKEMCSDQLIVVLEENVQSTQADDSDIVELILDSDPEPEEVSTKVQVLRSIYDSSGPVNDKQPSVASETVESDSTPIVSPVKTLQGTRMHVVQVASSNPLSPIKIVEENTEQQEEVFTDVESIYSTARTSFGTPKHTSPVILLELSDTDCGDNDNDVEPLSSMPMVKTVPKKRMRTTVLQVSAALKVQNYTDEKNNIKLRKIGDDIPVEVPTKDVEYEEIPDSQELVGGEGDNSVSIIEITREVHNNDYTGDESTDLFQVGLNKQDTCEDTSSPVVQIGGVENDILDSSLIEPVPEPESVPVPEEVQEQPQPTAIDKHTATQLREKFQLWGLKPVRGKEKMVEILQGISNFILPEHELLAVADKQELQSCIFRKLDAVIREGRAMYDRILSFEPIRLEELQLMLQSQDHYLELDVLRLYCDSSGITTTNA